MFKVPLSIAVATVLAWSGVAAAQQVSTRQITPLTGQPALRLVEQLRIGSLDGEHDAFARIMDVALSPSGRIAVADDQNYRVVLFAPDGRHLGTVGRRGSGPGEFQAPWRVAFDARDTLFVWDASHGRVSVWGPNLRLARTFPTPGGWLVNSMEILPDGSLVVAAYDRATGRTLHRFDRTGAHRSSFGPILRASDLAGFEASLLGGTFAVAEGTITYSSKSPYEVWTFDLEGRPIRRCRGDRRWTSDPATVVETGARETALHWRRYVHSSRILALGGGLFLNQVSDPMNDRTQLDLVDAECRLRRRTVLDLANTFTASSGRRLAGVRNLDYPEVVLYEWRIGG